MNSKRKTVGFSSSLWFSSQNLKQLRETVYREMASKPAGSEPWQTPAEMANNIRFAYWFPCNYLQVVVHIVAIDSADIATAVNSVFCFSISLFWFSLIFLNYYNVQNVIDDFVLLFINDKFYEEIHPHPHNTHRVKYKSTQLLIQVCK